MEANTDNRPFGMSSGKYRVIQSSIREFGDGYHNEVRLVENVEDSSREVQWWVWDNEKTPTNRSFWYNTYTPNGKTEAENDYKSVSWNVVRRFNTQ